MYDEIVDTETESDTVDTKELANGKSVENQNECILPRERKSLLRPIRNYILDFCEKRKPWCMKVNLLRTSPEIALFNLSDNSGSILPHYFLKSRSYPQSHGF